MSRARRLRRGLLVLGGLLIVGAGCSGGADSVATVLVDYEHDEFATQFIKYFPERVQVHPGDTISFEQDWTGEPHTVTLGTLVQDVLDVTRPLIAEHGDKPEDEVPPEVLETFFEAESQLPLFYSEEAEDPAAMPQTVAQPCLIQDGTVPDDGQPCEVRELVPFDGTPTYYNSGIIPYEGPGGNVFELELAESIEPGEYSFYCAVHGSFQSGVIEVVAPDQPIPAPDDSAADLRAQVNTMIEPYDTTFQRASVGDYSYRGEQHEWNYAGLLRDGAEQEGIINEFVPSEIEVKAGEPVVWRMFGAHSISFDVPEYLPIVEFLDDGTVRGNEQVHVAAGGAPEVPEEEGPPPDGPPEPLVIDGGTYDGSGFWSSGVLWADPYVEYTVRVSEPGSYRYACLIHPPMVGTLNVTE